MKRKLIYATLTGLFLLLFTSPGFGATKIYLPRDNRIKSHFNRFPKFSAAKLKDILILNSQENLRLLRKRTDRKKVTHLRYNQLFKGIPIWGYHIIVAEDQSGNIVSLHGTKVSDIAAGIKIGKLLHSDFDAQQALLEMKQMHIENSHLVDQFWEFKNESSQKMIYLDDSGEARVCYVVSFFVDVQQGGYPSRPTIIIDASTGKIIKEFDGLEYAVGFGPGGNEKTGKYQYGLDFPAFEVDELNFNCFMDTVKVKTWDMHNGSSPPTVHTFECYQNTYKEINGGFCPLNDAHFFGGVVYDLYQEWFDTAPLPFQIVIGVHWSNNIENAVWTGSEAIFGDGAIHFYPLVGLDVVSHEISHGFTEQNSNLLFDDQSGGINEAFSDMAGEAAEYYLKGTNDFMVGWEVCKGSCALRYMDDPPKDGISIDSANDYYEGMDIHRSSGVFNKAFYKLAVTPEWNTRKAFEVFVKANQDYWEPSTNFVQGAEGAYDAAVSLGYCAQAVKEAFEAVDIFIESRQSPQADFYYDITNFLTVEFTDNSKGFCDSIAWLWEFGDGHESTAQNPSHTYASVGTYTVRLTVTDSSGHEYSESKSLTVAEETTDYCESAGQIYNYQWIAKVTVGDFSNSSTASGYSEFVSEKIEIQKATPYSVTLTHGPAESSYQKFWRIWADLNQDGDFVDPGEKLFEGLTNDVITGNITVPMTAIDGQTRLRVSLSAFGYPPPCGNIGFGEVEDYTLIIGSIPEPVEPVADFTYISNGLTVSFNDQSTDPDSSIVNWLWEFGDGYESTAQHPTHTYTSGGTYTVRLTVTDSNGQEYSESKSLQIIDEQNEIHFPSDSDIFSNQYFSKFVAGASAEYAGYGGENGNWRSLNVNGKTTYSNVKCLIVRYDQSDGDYSVLYLAQASDRNIMCLRAFGYSEDVGNFDRDFSSSPVLFIPKNPQVRQTWTYIDGTTVTVESLNDFVPQMSTGHGPFPNCLRTKWQDGSETDYTYWSPTGLPVKVLNYNDGEVGGYELNKFIAGPIAMPGIILLLLQ